MPLYILFCNNINISKIYIIIYKFPIYTGCYQFLKYYLIEIESENNLKVVL